MHAFDRRTDRQTEISSQDRVCIPCSAVKIPYVAFQLKYYMVIRQVAPRYLHGIGLMMRAIRPTQAIEISAMFLCHLLRWPSIDIEVKCYGDRPRGTPPSGELNRRGVAEYSNFEPIDGYISETTQDRR